MFFYNYSSSQDFSVLGSVGLIYNILGYNRFNKCSICRYSTLLNEQTAGQTNKQPDNHPNRQINRQTAREAVGLKNSQSVKQTKFKQQRILL